MYFLFGNYGNNTIALVQWAKENNLEDVFVIHIETGWAEPKWHIHVKSAQQLATTYGFETISLSPQKTFPELIKERKNFPTAKYQWCTSFLKALPLLAWADEIDSSCDATILLGSRRADSRIRVNLPEYIYDSEHYNQRTVWYPLYLHTTEERDALIKRSGLQVLTHRSLECAPCIHHADAELKHLSHEKNAVIAELEKICQQTFPRTQQQNGMEASDMGCGSHYVCGE